MWSTGASNWALVWPAMNVEKSLRAEAPFNFLELRLLVYQSWGLCNHATVLRARETQWHAMYESQVNETDLSLSLSLSLSVVELL